MSGPSRLRELVESEDYRDQVEKYGGARVVDKALVGVLWSLTVNAEVWPVVPGFQRVRLALTDPVVVRGVTYPGLRIWFEIRDDQSTVDLLYLDLDSD